MCAFPPQSLPWPSCPALPPPVSWTCLRPGQPRRVRPVSSPRAPPSAAARPRRFCRPPPSSSPPAPGSSARARSATPRCLRCARPSPACCRHPRRSSSKDVCARTPPRARTAFPWTSRRLGRTGVSPRAVLGRTGVSPVAGVGQASRLSGARSDRRLACRFRVGSASPSPARWPSTARGSGVPAASCAFEPASENRPVPWIPACPTAGWTSHAGARSCSAA